MVTKQDVAYVLNEVYGKEITTDGSRVCVDTTSFKRSMIVTPTARVSTVGTPLIPIPT